MQWPLAVAVVVSRESRDEKAELVRNCPSENKDVKIRSLAFYSSEFVRKITGPSEPFDIIRELRILVSSATGGEYVYPTTVYRRLSFVAAVTNNQLPDKILITTLPNSPPHHKDAGQQHYL